MKKRIVLCADDYGQAPAISQGILSLVKANRLSAVSCMVTTENWEEHSQWLVPFQHQIDIGLHFNLTEGRSTLSVLMLKALLGRLNLQQMADELNAQIDEFEKALGFLPHFIDGHQHVHQFPIIREALVQVYAQRLKLHKPYIRVINEKFKRRHVVKNFKKMIIQGMGTKSLTKLLLAHQIPFNQSFSGIYHFAKRKTYTHLFPAFLSSIEQGGLIMCHPGYVESQDDPIALARQDELDYFKSEQFLTDCERYSVSLSRFATIEL